MKMRLDVTVPSLPPSLWPPLVCLCSFSEEEISNMRKELEKYGIQMPSFSKIGGILANELSVDEAACKTLKSELAVDIRLTCALFIDFGYKKQNI